MDLKKKCFEEINEGNRVDKYCNSAAAAAKSLQSCPTLHDPIDGSPPGSIEREKTIYLLKNLATHIRVQLLLRGDICICHPPNKLLHLETENL